MVINEFEHSKNFWLVTPQLKVPFKEFYDSDNSEDKSISSKIMWAIALIYDYDTPFFNYQEKDRIRESLKSMTLPEDTKLDNKLIDVYNALQYDSEKRYLAVWNKKIDEITDVLRDSVVTIQNIEDVTKALLLQEKLLQQKDEIMKRVKKKVDPNVRGGGNLSLLEEGRI